MHKSILVSQMYVCMRIAYIIFKHSFDVSFWIYILHDDTNFDTKISFNTIEGIWDVEQWERFFERIFSVQDKKGQHMC